MKSAGKEASGKGQKDERLGANSAPAKRATRTQAKPKAAKAKRPKGRPSDFTLELADRICAEMVCGSSLRSICKADDMPSCVTVFAWLRKYPDFLKRYEAAAVERANYHAEEMLDIADDGTNDWMEVHDKEGECIGYKINGEHVQRSRLRVDTRKWLMAKLQPKKYGEKVDVNHGVQPENPLATLMGQLAGKTLKPGAGQAEGGE